MADDSGYEEDAARIEREYVDPMSLSYQEVVADLEREGFPDASIEHIAGSSSSDDGWITTVEDAVPLVSPRNQSAEAFARSIDRQTGGSVSETRARVMGERFEEEVTQARAEAAQTFTIASDGSLRRPDGAPIGDAENVSEEIRDDGIYFRNDRTGREYKAASIDLRGAV